MNTFGERKTRSSPPIYWRSIIFELSFIIRKLRYFSTLRLKEKFLNTSGHLLLFWQYLGIFNRQFQFFLWFQTSHTFHFSVELLMTFSWTIENSTISWKRGELKIYSFSTDVKKSLNMPTTFVVRSDTLLQHMLPPEKKWNIWLVVHL